MIEKKSKKDVKDIDTKKEVQVTFKKQPKTQSYPLKVRLSVGGTWREVGESIKLTEGQYRDFRTKKIV
mgnify:CR=1 FL=1|jgi:hypothetical protein|tara:strand:- start:390 stop:593 length:204 start_codon:yes stop_codon:yes gene_type:complete